MPVATARTVALDGMVGHLVDVQADVSPGQVGTTLVGRADAALAEAKDRVRMAVLNSDLPWPATRRITVLLSPADLPKRGVHFDLPIAVAVLAAAGRVPTDSLAGLLMIGELSLDGSLRPATGVLPMVLAAAERGVHTVVVPEPQAREAAMVPGVTVLGMRSLAQVVAELCGDPVPEAAPVVEGSGAPLLTWRGSDAHEEVDLADLHGLAEARYAVEVAAAGGHHLMLIGPKGAGKTSLAERVPSVLPDLDREESLEVTAVHSLAGVLPGGAGFVVRPPYAAPHHDASKAAVVGGGSGQVRPGELSRAHGGVLFLDEFPLFRTDVLEALRQPLESGEISIARRDEVVTLPARALLVLACNPCPCGEYTASRGSNRCRCSEPRRRDYRAKLSGPVGDRIDIQRTIEPLRPHDARDVHAAPEPSLVVRARVALARERQRGRFEGHGWRLNAHVPSAALRDLWPLGPAAQRVLDDQVYAGRLTGRGAVRVHRLAWTVLDVALARAASQGTGDLEDVHGPPGLDHLHLALALRTGRALPASAVAVPAAARALERVR